MAQFWRIQDNQLLSVGEVDKLGFHEREGLRIPDEYLEQQEFTVMRTCHGIGDWGIISAMPRLLKEKYPNCKVYVPSEKLLEHLFGKFQSNWAWERPFANVTNVFTNNPYVDGFVDNIKGEVFHDHYRVYEDDTKIPLIKQILKFWQFEDNEMEDCQPEIYWTAEEKEIGEAIIHAHVGDDPFGTLLLSDRFEYDAESIYKISVKTMNRYFIKYPGMKMFYWTSKPLKDIPMPPFTKALDLRHVDPRIQLYIKSRAKFNVGNQCGMNDIIPRYAPVITIPRGDTRENTVPGEIYI